MPLPQGASTGYLRPLRSCRLTRGRYTQYHEDYLQDDTYVLLRHVAKGEGLEVRRVVVNGVDVNSCDFSARTALHVAASEGFLSIVEFLLSRGADWSMRDSRGSTAFDDAVKFGHADVAALLEKTRLASPSPSPPPGLRE